jgi:hypothetical protein
VRHGAEFFLLPESSAQHRYEALRAYFVEEMTAAEVSERFGYSTASVRQMATRFRHGQLRFFSDSRPPVTGPAEQIGELRAAVFRLWAEHHDITAIVEALKAQRTSISEQVVRRILRPRVSFHRPAIATSRPRPAAPTSLPDWPADTSLYCANAGLLLLLPLLVGLDMHRLVESGGYPASGTLTPWQVVGNLLLAKCAWHDGEFRESPHDDPGLAFALGATALPTPQAMAAYSRRIGHATNGSLLCATLKSIRERCPAAGDAGFNLGIRVIRGGRDLGGTAVSDRAPDGRAVRALFAQDHAVGSAVYSSVVTAKRPADPLAFADHWRDVSGADPGLLVFDSHLTTYDMLSELSRRGVPWLTNRQRSRAELARLSALPSHMWRAMDGAGCGKGELLTHDGSIRVRGIDTEVRRIVVTDSARADFTVLITNDRTSPAAELVRRRAERSIVENELDAQIMGFHLGPTESGACLHPDLENTLTVIAGGLYRLFAHYLPRHGTASLDAIWTHFLDGDGVLHIAEDTVTCAFEPRGYHQAVLAARVGDREFPIPWWGGRRLRFRFPAG